MSEHLPGSHSEHVVTPRHRPLGPALKQAVKLAHETSGAVDVATLKAPSPLRRSLSDSRPSHNRPQ
jgi:hypothetical protein